jgi:hypothetical protein
LIFGLKAAGGIKPYYVGKTSGQNFTNEVFTADKMLKYRDAMDKKIRHVFEPLNYIIKYEVV